MDIEEFKKCLKNQNAEILYKEFLLNEDVFIFKEKTNPTSHYHNYKIAISDILEINPKNIAIIGSAKTGFSLSPSKNFKEFEPDPTSTEASDIDLIIISEKYYKLLWENALNYKYSFVGRSYKHRANEIFRHFISIKINDLKSEEAHFFKDWIIRVEAIKKISNTKFNILNDINYRVYESWDFADTYHIKGMEELKNA